MVMLRRVCCGLNCVILYLQMNTCISLMSAVATFDIMLKELECLFTLSANSLPCVIGIVNTEKHCSISFSGVVVTVHAF